MDDRKFIDPAELRATDLPFIILVDDLRSFVGWAIKHHTNGNYNHIMTMTRLGFIETQGFGLYRRVPLSNYLKPGLMLKFWKVKLTVEEIKIFNERVEQDLKKPWWRRLYDIPGIVGQYFGLKWIQSPWQMYCSEIVAAQLRAVPRLKETIAVRPSPAFENIIFNNNPDVFHLIGYYRGQD